MELVAVFVAIAVIAYVGMRWVIPWVVERVWHSGGARW